MSEVSAMFFPKTTSEFFAKQMRVNSEETALKGSPRSLQRFFPELKLSPGEDPSPKLPDEEDEGEQMTSKNFGARRGL